MGTDPNDPNSYPAGFPAVPEIPVDTIQKTLDGLSGGSGTPHGGGKIIDLRVPLSGLVFVPGQCPGTSAFNDPGVPQGLSSSAPGGHTAGCVTGNVSGPNQKDVIVLDQPDFLGS